MALGLCRRIAATIVCFSFFLLHVQAGNTKGWGAVGSVYLESPFGNYIADVGIIRTWGLGKYLTLGAGAKFSYVQTDGLTTEWYAGDQRYGFDFDKSLMGLHGLGTVDVHCPIVKSLGVYGNLSASFDILPWDYLEIRKYAIDNPVSYDAKTIYAYNRFAPRLFAGGGLFYDFKGDKSVVRVALGYSYGYYDALPGSRRKTFEGQRLGDHLPGGDQLHNLSIKIICYH